MKKAYRPHTYNYIYYEEYVGGQLGGENRGICGFRRPNSSGPISGGNWPVPLGPVIMEHFYPNYAPLQNGSFLSCAVSVI